MYLLAQDTLNGAEGKITVTRDGRITEICGMKNIKTVAGIQTSDMKTIGTRTVQKKANGVTQTGTGNVYFGSNGSNLFTDMLLQYINTGVMDESETPNADTLEAFEELDNGGGHTYNGPVENLISSLLEDESA